MSEQQTPQRGVKVELGGRTLYLRYSLAARRRMIQAIGGEDKLSELKGDQLATILVEGLKSNTPEVTAEWLEEEIDMQNLPEVMEKMSEAMGQKKAVVQIEGEA